VRLRATLFAFIVFHFAQPVVAAERGTPSINARLPGTSIDFSTYAEVFAGYDTNPDNLEVHTGSRFEKTEAGLTATSKSDGDVYTASVTTRQYEFQDLTDDFRWDLYVKANATLDISTTQTLKMGASYLRDYIPLNKADVFRGYLDYYVVEDDYQVRMQAKSGTEINFGNDVQGMLNKDIFDVTKGPAYDYSKSEGQIAVLLMPKSWWQPFATYNFSYTDYFHQVADPILNRTAPEHFAIAGLRFKPDQAFRIDAGARVNNRRFDDLDIPSLTTWAFDGNFSWKPTATFELTGVIERQLKETTSSFGLVDDVQTYGLTADWRPADRWRLDASAYYDHFVPIGDKFVYDKYTATAGAAYAASDHLELFASGLAKLVQEQTDSKQYTRYKIGAGARIKF
jgi:Putative beta-barrel porin 2